MVDSPGWFAFDEIFATLIDQERQDLRLHLGCALCTPHERPDYPYRPTQPKPSGPPNVFDKPFVPQPQRH